MRNLVAEKEREEVIGGDGSLPVLQKEWNQKGSREEQEKEWRDAPATFGEDGLEILGVQVMQEWEEPLMQELAKKVTEKGGRILEIGFGMGISAKMIQEYEIEEHVIIEANKEVYKNLVEYSKISPHKVTPLLGFWQTVMPTLPEGSFDGILFDDYPISSQQRDEFAETMLFKESYRLLKKGGVLVYYSGEKNDFSDIHMKKIQELPWEEILCRDINVFPPDNCEYWKEKTMLAPLLIK